MSLGPVGKRSRSSGGRSIFPPHQPRPQFLGSNSRSLLSQSASHPAARRKALGNGSPKMCPRSGRFTPHLRLLPVRETPFPRPSAIAARAHSHSCREKLRDVETSSTGMPASSYGGGRLLFTRPFYLCLLLPIRTAAISHQSLRPCGELKPWKLKPWSLDLGV
jgi:hypothetical protein